MNIGILGTGNMASGLGKLWAAKGHKIMFGSRDPAKAKKLAADIGKTCSGGSLPEAVKFGPVVLLAVTWTGADKTIKAAGSLDGKIVIDLTNPLSKDFMNLVVGFTTSAGEGSCQVGERRESNQGLQHRVLAAAGRRSQFQRLRALGLSLR